MKCSTMHDAQKLFLENCEVVNFMVLKAAHVCSMYIHYLDYILLI